MNSNKNNNNKPKDDWIAGRTVVLTGCTHGLGLTALHSLIERGARVCALNRNRELAERVRHELGECLGEDAAQRVILYQCDLSSLESVANCAASLLAAESKIHVLINNAATFCTEFKYSSSGYEMQFQVNQLGPYYLTKLLLQRIKDSQPSRIVIVASMAYKYANALFDPEVRFRQEVKNYSSFRAYKYTKLANVYWALALTQSLSEGSGVDVHFLHPGAVKTNLGGDAISKSNCCMRCLVNLFRCCCMITPESGAVAILRCACDAELQGRTGHFYTSNGREAALSNAVQNAAGLAVQKNSELKDIEENMCKKIWDFCENGVRNHLLSDSESARKGSG